MMLLTAIGWGMTPIGSESLITDSALYVVLFKEMSFQLARFFWVHYVSQWYIVKHKKTRRSRFFEFA